MSRGGKGKIVDLTHDHDHGHGHDHDHDDDDEGGHGMGFDMKAIAKALTEKLPGKVQRRVRGLRNVQAQCLALERQYDDEVKALDLKYQKLYEPLYAKRATIVNGEYEPTEEECTVKDGSPLPDDKEESKGVPNFWLTALRNNAYVGDSIADHDEDALGYLRDIRCALLEGEQQGFRLTFHFAENPFFTDSVLTKTYFYTHDDIELSNDFVWDRSEGCKINWKPGKNLTVKLVKQKQPASKGRGKKGKPTPAKVTTVEEEQESFFHFFNPLSMDDEELDPEEESEIAHMLEADFEAGNAIQEKIIPKAVFWFTGEAIEMDDADYDYEGDEDEFDDEDDDGEDEEEEEEEEEELPPPKKGGAKGAARGGGGGGGGGGAKGGKGGQPPQQQPECKQQ